MAVSDVHWMADKLDEPLVIIPRSLFMRAMEMLVYAEERSSGGFHHGRILLAHAGRTLPESLLPPNIQLKGFEVDVIPSQIIFKEKQDA